MTTTKIIAGIPEGEKTPVVLSLIEIIREQEETIQSLKDEIARLKGINKKPKVPPSNLEKPNKKNEKKEGGKRAGSAKRKKTKSIEIHRTKVIEPESIPEGSVFKGYQDYTVQNLKIESFNTLYRLRRYEGPNGEYIVGKLPDCVNGHYGIDLKAFILYQYYNNHVTQPLIYEQLAELGVDISSGQINEIIVENKEPFHEEKEALLEAGLKSATHINVDDTGARHDGKNGYCTHVGNESFAFYESTDSKSRINFLKILRGCHKDYVINAEALIYMEEYKLPKSTIATLCGHIGSVLENADAWAGFLQSAGIEKPRHVQIATEGALVGSLMEHGFNRNLVIVSDDAGQFNVFLHALCWIHAERTVNRLVGFNDEQKNALDAKRSEIWDFYNELKEYKVNPDPKQKERLDKRFDEIFKEKTVFQTLNKAMQRIHANKGELLLVLERPEIPLHNNLSENDIREYVKRRKISGSTRSLTGRKCRDTFTSLKKTCRKQGISFWVYLKDRLKGGLFSIPYLPDLVSGDAELSPI